MLDKYIEQYKLLYQIKPKYGASSVKLFDIILPLVEKSKSTNILDYGCGRSPLVDMLKDKLPYLKVFRYDPVFEQYNTLPNEAIDFLICTDVLQHVPEYDLENNLKEISSISKKCFFHIKCTDHPTCFPNGEPTNCTVHDKNWWKKELDKYFNDISFVENGDETSVSFLTN